MSLVFAGLLPHPPMLLPSIGREHSPKLQKTWAAYQTILDRLNESRPDTILIISPHLSVLPQAFSVNLSPLYRTHFSAFGDFSEPKEFKPDSMIVERIRHHGRLAGNQVMLYDEEHLDYGSGVPLSFLPNDPEPQIVPIAPSLGNAKAHFTFGQVLKEVILPSERRIAVIASGDLSHRHGSDTPRGYTARAKVFDDQLIANLSAGNATPTLQMDETLVGDAHACGFRPLAMLLGMLDRIEYRPELLAYEHPFGVGYCTMQFHLANV